MKQSVKQVYWYFRESLRNLAHERLVDPLRTTTVRGKSISIGLSNPLEGFRISTYAEKEPETLDWLEKNLGPGDVLYDIGANIGLYSIYAAKACPKATVYAFEPMSLNFVRLCRNVYANQLSNVMPLCVALTDQTKFDFMNITSLESGTALHGFGSEPMGGPAKVTARQGIVGTSLDDLVYNWNVPIPNCIKLDVDGIEDLILRGGKRVLSDPRCRSLLVEIECENGKPLGPCADILISHGFTISKTSDWEVSVGGTKLKNFIFTRA